LSVDAAAAMALRGVHSFAAVTREYAVSSGAQGLLGHVDANNAAVEGLELSLDSILRGVPGSTTVIKDSKGRCAIAARSESRAGEGQQRRADDQCRSARDRRDGAREGSCQHERRGRRHCDRGSKSGEILAMASRRLDPRATSASVFTEPFEPGSTMKPFLAAGLLDRGRVTDHDSVDTGDGVWRSTVARSKTTTNRPSAVE
jgi:cell division protein FtsI (penicillin-binding protein 3)